ncbi:MAG: TetR/AcrR family transcriptional regulator [Candidatus Sericytochromatia bacterium]|nr:TetR/AcrR family transcriptional regulator [Candidatus Sericytochromatia bacterium]
MPKPADVEQREARILDAAATLFVHYGFDKTSVADIAREAGISKGAIYLHFESKEALFEALLLREMQSYAAEWLARVEADPAGGTLGGMYRNVLHALNASPLMAALFKQDRRLLGAYLRNPQAALRSRTHGSMRHELIDLLQQAGAVRQELDPVIVAHIMNMLAYGLVAMDEIMDPADIPPTEALIEGIADLMDRALTPPDGGDSAAGKAVLQQIYSQARQQLADAVQKGQNHD